MRQATTSFLQLQLGQEVVYLLLAAFSLLSLVLGLFLSQVIAEKDHLSAELASNTKQHDLARLDLAQTKLDLDRLRTKLLDFESTSLDLSKDQKRMIENLSAELKRAGKTMSDLKDTVLRLDAEKNSLLIQLSDKPPIINLTEAQGYTFESGDSRVSDDFRQKLLDTVLPKLLVESERYRAKVIEVIGHTDEVKVPVRSSNLDSRLVPFLNAEGPDNSLLAGDNTGLGMARAAAVVRVLMAQETLKDYVILPFSAGQIIDVDGQLSRTQSEKDVRKRRRIEIRLRR